MTVYGTLVKQHINVGDASNDGTGDSIRDAFIKTNGNFDLLFDAVSQGEGLTYLGLQDTPTELIPFAVQIVDEIGFTLTQLTIETAGTIAVNPDYEAGKLYIYGGLLVQDPDPTLSATLQGAGYRARNFGDPEHDQDLVTRRWLYENFLNRDATTVTEYLVYTTESGYITSSTTVGGSTLRHNVSLILSEINTSTNSPGGTDSTITVYDANGDLTTVNLTEQAWQPSHLTRKDYVDTKISLQGTQTIDPMTGEVNPGFGQMTGDLELYRDPNRAVGTDEPLLAATKNYVDYIDRFNISVDTQDLLPTTNLTYSLGSVSRKYLTAHIQNLNIHGSSTFDGPVTFNNTATYIQSNNVISTDNMIEIHAPTGGVGGTWSSDDGKDIGIRIHYYNSGDKNAALIFANDSRSLEWYETGTEGLDGVFVGSTYGSIKTGHIRVLGSTTATTATINNVLYVNKSGSSGAVILPGNPDATQDNNLDIGSSGARFRNVYAANFYGSGANLTNIPNSGLTSSSVTVSAGIGLSGGGTISLGGSVTINNAGVTSIIAGTDISISQGTGAVTISDTSTLQTVTDRGATTDHAISITNSTAAVNPTTGALKVTGGTGIQGDLYVGGNIYRNGGTIVYGYTGSQGYTGSKGDQGNIGYTGSGSTVAISNTAPSSPVDGKLWFDTGSNLRLYVWSSDSAAWIDASPGGGSGGGSGSGVGSGQTWQDVTASRTWDTTYTNSTGGPIQVSITNSGGDWGECDFYVDGVLIASSFQVGAYVRHQISAIIPDGSSYILNRINGGAADGEIIETWCELR